MSQTASWQQIEEGGLRLSFACGQSNRSNEASPIDNPESFRLRNDFSHSRVEHCASNPFYSHLQNENRDLTIAIVCGHLQSRGLLNDVGLRPQFRVLDLYCGIGVRGLRYASVIPNSKVCCVDVNPQCIEMAQWNTRANQIDLQQFDFYCKPVHEFLLSSVSSNNNTKYDLIEIDPFGSPYDDIPLAAKLLDTQNGGLLCLTFTDKNVLFGDCIHTLAQSYGCFSSSIPDIAKRECSLRFVLTAIIRQISQALDQGVPDKSTNTQQFEIKPIASWSFSHGCRFIIEVKSVNTRIDTSGNFGPFFQSSNHPYTVIAKDQFQSLSPDGSTHFQFSGISWINSVCAIDNLECSLQNLDSIFSHLSNTKRVKQYIEELIADTIFHSSLDDMSWRLINIADLLHLNRNPNSNWNGRKKMRMMCPSVTKVCHYLNNSDQLFLNRSIPLRHDIHCIKVAIGVSVDELIAAVKESMGNSSNDFFMFDTTEIVSKASSTIEKSIKPMISSLQTEKCDKDEEGRLLEPTINWSDEGFCRSAVEIFAKHNRLADVKDLFLRVVVLGDSKDSIIPTLINSCENYRCTNSLVSLVAPLPTLSIFQQLFVSPYCEVLSVKDIDRSLSSVLESLLSRQKDDKEILKAHRRSISMSEVLTNAPSVLVIIVMACESISYKIDRKNIRFPSNSLVIGKTSTQTHRSRGSTVPIVPTYRNHNIIIDVALSSIEVTCAKVVMVSLQIKVVNSGFAVPAAKLSKQAQSTSAIRVCGQDGRLFMVSCSIICIPDDADCRRASIKSRYNLIFINSQAELDFESSSIFGSFKYATMSSGFSLEATNRVGDRITNDVIVGIYCGPKCVLNMSNSTVKNCTSAGIMGSCGAVIRVLKCNVSNNATSSLYAIENCMVEISDSKLNSNGRCGFESFGSMARIDIHRTEVTNNHAGGILLSGCAHGLIRNCIISRNTFANVSVQDSASVTIENCRIIESNSAGIVIKGKHTQCHVADDCEILDNYSSYDLKPTGT